MLKELDEKTKDTKWSEYWEKNFDAPMFHAIPKGISQEELEYVARLYRLDEIYRRIQFQDFDIYDDDTRSESPEPIYDPKTGIRTNTRKKRVQKKLEHEKIEIIEELMETHQ